MELCFTQYNICAGGEHLQDTQVKDPKDHEEMPEINRKLSKLEIIHY